MPTYIHHPSELVELSSRLQAAVLEALWDFDAIRQSLPRLEVETRAGIVELRGNVRSRAIKATAADLARNVPGVREVINNLVSDTDIELQAAAALVRDPRTRLMTDKISVKSRVGTVLLRGRVASEEIKAAAEEIIAQMAGVQGVVNELVAPPKPKPAPAPAKPAAPARPLAPARPTTPEPVAEAIVLEAEAVTPAPTPAIASEPVAIAPTPVSPAAPVSGARRDAAGRPISPHGKSAPKLSEDRRKLVLAARGS